MVKKRVYEVFIIIHLKCILINNFLVLWSYITRDGVLPHTNKNYHGMPETLANNAVLNF